MNKYTMCTYKGKFYFFKQAIYTYLLKGQFELVSLGLRDQTSAPHLFVCDRKPSELTLSARASHL